MIKHVNATRTTKLQDDKKCTCFKINTQRLRNFYCTELLKIQQNDMYSKQMRTMAYRYSVCLLSHFMTYSLHLWLTLWMVSFLLGHYWD